MDILYLRFANAILEPVWNRRYVDSRPDHDGRGLRRRGPRQLLRPRRRAARRGPEPPAPGARAGRDGAAVGRQRPDPVRDRKLDLFRGDARRPTRVATCAASTTGYRDVDGVAPDSDTETFVALRLEIDNWRWYGVPFFIRAGKSMPVKVTEVRVVFQRPPRLGIGGGCPRPRRADPADPARTRAPSSACWRRRRGEDALQRVHLDLLFERAGRRAARAVRAPPCATR